MDGRLGVGLSSFCSVDEAPALRKGRPVGSSSLPFGHNVSNRASSGNTGGADSNSISRDNSNIFGNNKTTSLDQDDMNVTHASLLQMNSVSQKTLATGSTMQEPSAGGSVASRGSSTNINAQNGPRMGSFGRFTDVHGLKRNSVCQVLACRTVGTVLALSSRSAGSKATVVNKSRGQYASGGSSTGANDRATTKGKHGAILTSTLSMSKKAQALASYFPPHVAGGRSALSSHNSSADQIRWVDNFYSAIAQSHDSNPSLRYVLKVYNKAELVKRKRMENVLRECYYLHRIDCPFICRLEWQFQTANSICLVLEAAECGDLFRLVHGNSSERYSRSADVDSFEDGLSLEMIRFYAASILLALNHLHSRGMVYRNLKLESIVLDEKGYVKLVGLGLVKKFPYYHKDGNKAHGLPQYRTFTICGTTEYFAPEQVLDVGHEQAADMWAFGVLLHEMLLKSSPFMPPPEMMEDNGTTVSRSRRSTDPNGAFAYNASVSGDAFAHLKEIMNNIMALQWNPINLQHEKFYQGKDTMELKALIEDLLVFEPHERLSTSRKSSRNNVFHHLFFDHFDWDALDSLQYNASYLPFRKVDEFKTPRSAFMPPLPGSNRGGPASVGPTLCDENINEASNDSGLVFPEKPKKRSSSICSSISKAFKFPCGSGNIEAGSSKNKYAAAAFDAARRSKSGGGPGPFGAGGVPHRNGLNIDEGAPFTGDQSLFSGFNFD